MFTNFAFKNGALPCICSYIMIVIHLLSSSLVNHGYYYQH